MFTSEIYSYPMRLKRNLVKKLNEFYIEFAKKKKKKKKKKIKKKKNQEFQENEIKKLNENISVDMTSTKIRGGKAFGTEKKIRELKKRVLKFKGIKSKSKVITPMMLIKKSTDNMNQSEKNGSAPNYIEKKSLSNEKFRIVFNFE